MQPVNGRRMFSMSGPPEVKQVVFIFYYRSPLLIVSTDFPHDAGWIPITYTGRNPRENFEPALSGTKAHGFNPLSYGDT